MLMGFWLIFVLLIVGATAYPIGWRPESSQPSSGQTPQTPAEILKARYARGEITREEYEQVHRDLAG